MEVVGPEQPGRFRTDPDHGVAALAIAYDGDEQRLGRVTHLDPIETFDPDVVDIRQLSGEPGGQPLLDPAHQRCAGN